MKRLFFILGVLTSTACAASPADPTAYPTATANTELTVVPRPSETASPISPTPSPTTVPILTLTPDHIGESVQEITGDPVIVFKQEGGFAGVDLTWSIYANGTIVLPTGEYIWVEPVVVEDLLALFAQAGFFELEQTKSSNICCDYFTFTLAANNGDQNNVLTFTDGDPNAPAVLSAMVSVVRQEIAQGSKNLTE